ncbi:hypothetical protein [Polaribacter sp. Asnod1-A03]
MSSNIYEGYGREGVKDYLCDHFLNYKYN